MEAWTRGSLRRRDSLWTCCLVTIFERHPDSLGFSPKKDFIIGFNISIYRKPPNLYKSYRNRVYDYVCVVYVHVPEKTQNSFRQERNLQRYKLVHCKIPIFLQQSSSQPTIYMFITNNSNSETFTVLFQSNREVRKTEQITDLDVLWNSVMINNGGTFSTKLQCHRSQMLCCCSHYDPSNLRTPYKQTTTSITWIPLQASHHVLRGEWIDNDTGEEDLVPLMLQEDSGDIRSSFDYFDGFSVEISRDCIGKEGRCVRA